MGDFERKNDLAWRELLERHDILARIERDGFFVISAKQIKTLREPRLMAKFDHALNLPAVFKKHGLGILPVSRGEYILSHFHCYMPVPPASGPIVRMPFPHDLNSIDPIAITSEAVAVNCAAAAGIFAEFLEADRLTPTVSGRMGSGAFSYHIADSRNGRAIPVEVNNAQIEIDAAFESRDSLTIVEAKQDLSDDFIVRQLFYPYKTWENRVPKPVRLVYMVHSNGIFTLTEYAVENGEDYNSLKHVKTRRYAVDDTEIRQDDIAQVMREVKITPEPEIPFPQANSFERVVNLCELLAGEAMSYDAITERYDFDNRQTNYYTNAGRYLGLMEKSKDDGKTVYSLTDDARAILRLRYRERQLALCKRILSHAVFMENYGEWLRLGYAPALEKIVESMKRANLYKVHGDTTFSRRAGTVLGWLHWIDSLSIKGLFALPATRQ